MVDSFDWLCDPVMCLLAGIRAWDIDQNSCLPDSSFNIVLPRCAVGLQR